MMSCILYIVNVVEMAFISIEAQRLHWDAHRDYLFGMIKASCTRTTVHTIILAQFNLMFTNTPYAITFMLTYMRMDVLTSFSQLLHEYPP